MKKIVPFALTIIITMFSSCGGEEEETPSFPTEEDVTGYWKLEKIIKGGAQIAYSQYPSTLTTNTMENMYYSFDGSKKFELIVELSISVVVRGGDWDLVNDIITTNYTGSGVPTVLKVKSFSAEEIIMVDEFLPDYNLVFKRIEGAVYPKTSMEATVNGQSFNARSNQAYDEGDFIQLTGDNNNSDWISITLNQFENLQAGQTYPIDGSTISAVYALAGNFSNLYGSFEGEMSVLQISDYYISITFNFKAKTTGGAQVDIVGGKFTAIIKNNI